VRVDTRFLVVGKNAATTPTFSGFESLASNVRTLKRRIVVFLGSRSQHARGVEILSLKDFLAELPIR
jgi:hypothetical protein